MTSQLVEYGPGGFDAARLQNWNVNPPHLVFTGVTL